ncbi:MAG: OmpA family protein [Myxococcales bacterium]|nr:OmpA family protein [Myxococcales bacterium]
MVKRALFVLAVVAPCIAGCQKELPARPVPQPEEQAQMPAWFPENPWNQRQADDRLLLEGKVVFDTAKATIRPQSLPVLEKLYQFLVDNPDVSRIRLEGHTDARADEDYNQGLGERRAVAVADWLVDRGLDNMRLLAVSFGEGRPIAPNNTPAGMQENRRASFHIAELNGAQYHGKDPTNGGLVIEILSKEDRERMKQAGKVPTAADLPKVEIKGDVIEPVKPERPSNVPRG